MQSTKFPASVSDVADSLQEAVGYERLQWERQRGRSQLLMAGVLGVFFLVTAGTDDWSDWAKVGAIWAFTLAFIGLLVWSRRRPAWRALFEPPGFVRLPLMQDRHRLASLLLLLVYIGLREVAHDASEGILRAVGASGILLVAAMLSWAAARVHDRSMMAIYAASSAFAIPVALGLVTSAGVQAWFVAVLCLPTLFLGIVRSFAPRRWLIK